MSTINETISNLYYVGVIDEKQTERGWSTKVKYVFNIYEPERLFNDRVSYYVGDIDELAKSKSYEELEIRWMSIPRLKNRGSKPIQFKLAEAIQLMLLLTTHNKHAFICPIDNVNMTTTAQLAIKVLPSSTSNTLSQNYTPKSSHSSTIFSTQAKSSQSSQSSQTNVDTLEDRHKYNTQQTKPNNINTHTQSPKKRIIYSNKYLHKNNNDK